MKSKKSNKPQPDKSTPKGRAALSQVRNRGATRLLKRLKKYQKKSQHKVLVNFMPTWKGGKPRVWLSHSPEEITPVFKAPNGDIKPFSRALATEESDTDESDRENDKSGPSGSTRMSKRSPAAPGSKEKKRDLKLKCGHCCTGPDLEDLHPFSPWIRCGVKRCKSENFCFHSVCHGIRLLKNEEKSFNEKYSRCNKHFVKQVKVSNMSEEGSDIDDFVTKKKKKTKKPAENLSPINKGKKNPSPQKVFTPGTKGLRPITKKKEIEPEVLEEVIDDDSKEDSGDDSDEESGDDMGEESGEHSDEESDDNSEEEFVDHSEKKRGDHSEKKRGDHSEQKRGEHSEKIKGDHSEKIKGDHSEKKSGDSGEKEKEDHSVKETGDHSKKASRASFSDSSKNLRKKSSLSKSSESTAKVASKPAELNHEIIDLSPAKSFKSPMKKVKVDGAQVKKRSKLSLPK